MEDIFVGIHQEESDCKFQRMKYAQACVSWSTGETFFKSQFASFKTIKYEQKQYSLVSCFFCVSSFYDGFMISCRTKPLPHMDSAFLDHTFQNNWIGQRGQIECPACSLDLTPPNLSPVWTFIIWVGLKTCITNLYKLIVDNSDQ